MKSFSAPCRCKSDHFLPRFSVILMLVYFLSNCIFWYIWIVCHDMSKRLLLIALYKHAGSWYTGGTQIAVILLKSRGQALSNDIWHPYVAQYRHVIYRWKALDFYFSMPRGTQLRLWVLALGVLVTVGIWRPFWNLHQNGRHIPTLRYKMVAIYHLGVVDYDIYPLWATHIPLGFRPRGIWVALIGYMS